MFVSDIMAYDLTVVWSILDDRVIALHVELWYTW